MQSKLILFLLLTYTAISRFFIIDKIPLLTHTEFLNWRFLSAGVSTINIVTIFFLIRGYFKNTKIALITTWVFSILPWVFEQGRIISQVNLVLSLILIIFLFIQKNSRKWRFGLIVFIPIIIFLAYSSFWFFRADQFKFNISSFITNLFILLSFDFLFFKNITFWWGGVRDFGVMFLSWLPFFLLGLYNLITGKRLKLLILFGLITFIASLSPFFPESREFYFATPLICTTVASGIYRWSLQKSVIARILFFCLFVLMIYEFSQFNHFYFVHYSQQVMSNFSQIHEPF